ncbi:MAG: hypothetical protein WD766_12995 [Gemmatimonadota bacterium]
MTQTIYDQGEESAPPSLRLPAAAGVLAGRLVLAIALALIAGD